MSRAMGAGRTERRQRFDYCLNACRLHAGGQWVHDELLDASSLNKSSLKVGGFQQDHALSQSLADEKLKNPTHTQNAHTHIVDQLDHPSFQADCASYGALLRACTRAKALSHGLRIHDHIIKTGLEQNVYLNNLIVDMYGRGDGSMLMAHALFTKMSHPDLFSWNFMIRAYAHNGLYKEALELFQQLLWQGMMLPDQYIYVSILSVCASIKAITQGKQLHIQISSSGFELEVIVATALINMYGKCGSLVDAWKVFNKMPQRDAVSWNTMIAACVLHGHSKDAIQLFKQLHEEGEVPNKATFTTILDACLLHEALLEGKHIHACIAAREFESDLVVRTALSNMYSKCTTMESSQSMPDTTKEPNGLLQGTLLLTTYAQQGLIEEALQLFEQMQLKEILPDKYGFVSMISSCASQAAFAEGEQMHAYVAGTRMEIDVVVGTALISMYGKSGKPEVARTLFDKMPIHDVVSWTAMIAAYSQNGKGKDALELFKQMKQKGLEPNKVTFATIFDACTSEDFLAEGRHVHQDILGSKLELDVYVGTALVNMYGRFRCLEDARMIFDKMASHDVIAWNAIIAALAHNEEGARTLQLFRQMQEQGMMPNKVTFISTFDACAIHLALPEGKRIHAQVVVNKLESDIVLGTALINMYGRCGCLENARRIFDAILKRDIVSWTAIMAAYAHYGQIKEAFKLFDEMQHAGLVPDKISCISILSACVSKTGIDEGRQMHTRVVACGLDLDVSVTNGLITMYDKCGSVEDAMRTFEKMLGRDRDTYVSILFACANQLDLAEGRKMHTHIVKTGYELEVPVGNALINMFSKCGSLQEAGMVFETMPERDVVSWTIMIASYAQHGHGEYALQLFDQMQKEGLFPNMVTFVNILNAFSHAGMVDEGFQCFGYISQNQSTMSPIEDHYNCIVDLLGRAGRLSEAEHFIRKMPFPPSVVSWTSLLNACRHHVDVERGERAAEHVFRMEPNNPAPYITMYNLYTTVRRVDDAAMVIYRLKEKGLLKGEVAACVT